MNDGAIIGFIILAAIYIGILYLFARYVAIYLLAATASLMAAGALLLYVRSAIRVLIQDGGEEDRPTGGQPAFKLYFYRKAYIDYKDILLDAWREFRYWAVRLARWGEELFNEGIVWFTWPVGLVYFVSFVPAVAASAAACMLLGVVHLLLMGFFAAITVLVASAFRACEYASMLARGIFIACPHPNCYKRISLPLYRCPKCGAEHDRLIPGSYGIFTRKCRCGSKLPTLFLFGRNRLPSFCPHESCKRPLSENLGVTRNAHIPIAGGPSTGKTTYLIAGMMAISEKTASRHLSLEFDDELSKREFERSRDSLLNGDRVLKTVDFSPTAFVTRVESSKGKPVLLHVYDAAGELFATGDRIKSQLYYSYVQGILLLIDPFSLPRVAAENEEQLRDLLSDLSPSSEGPQDVYGRMVSTLRSFAGKQHRALQQRIAVVLTKCDALDLGVKLDVLAKAAEEKATTEKAGTSPESDAVRNWLCEKDLGNLVRQIEHDFRSVRFFYCSAVESLGNPAAARNALRPLTWLLEGFGIDPL